MTLSIPAKLIRREQTVRVWIPVGFRLFAISLAGLHAWVAARNFSMNEDGISYLDIGDAYFRGDWQAAINPVWSPVYSWILGLVNYVVKPSMYWEFPLVHFVNLAIFIFALLCFEYFWSQVLKYKNARIENTPRSDTLALPDWALMALGYVLFIYGSLCLIQIWAVTPDMLMAALVLLASGVLLKIRLEGLKWQRFVQLGFLLGLGYLTKSVMFPLAFVFLAASAFSVQSLRRSVPYALLAAVVFLLIAAPFVTLISIQHGSFTIGEAGKLTYIKHMNDIPYPHWQGEPPGSGTPVHPSRKIFENPAIYEFATPIGGTYPISYNPAYWYEGAVQQFNPGRQFFYLLNSLRYYLDLFFRQQAALVIGVLLLYWYGLRIPFAPIPLLSHWGLLLPAVAAFSIYATMLVIGRYIAVFVVLFWADLLANIRLPNSSSSRKLLSVLVFAVITFMVMNIGIFNLEGVAALKDNTDPSSFVEAGPPSWPGAAAQELHRLGVQPGNRVAVIGWAFTSFWARLARVKIVAEMFHRESDAFWLGTETFREQVLNTFARTGAVAVVAEDVPRFAPTEGWYRVGQSSSYIYLIER